MTNEPTGCVKGSCGDPFLVTITTTLNATKKMAARNTCPRTELEPTPPRCELQEMIHTVPNSSDK
jgi:hypothetical protein